MKRHNLTPRPCPCQGTCDKCDGMIKPYELDTPRIFNKRQHCCMFCPVLRARKKTYRHVKKREPVKHSGWDLFIMGKLTP